MAPSKFKRAIGAVKDQTSIGLAKVGNSDTLSDLDVAIVKATRHEEYPADERHIREILCQTSYSRVYVSACVNTLSRRLNKTRNWTVALKTLMLIQRLLAEGDPAFEQEIFFATRRGTRLLNMSDFRDTSRSNSWDYSAFVRTYALYLDERLEFKMQSRRDKCSAFGFDEAEDQESGQVVCSSSTPLHEMKSDQVFSRVQHLQQLLERFLACRPTGGAKSNRVVIVALYPIVKESFQIYYDTVEVLGILIDLFVELDIPESVKVYDIFCRVSKQFDELDTFYTWCKATGIARSSEYPEVEKITRKKLELMDAFISDKSALARTKIKDVEPDQEEVKELETNEQDDMNAMKALPAPESSIEEVKEEEKEEEPAKEDNNAHTRQEADLLNLGEDAVSTEEHANQLALALFDGAGAAPGPSATTLSWDALNDIADWETALVQSASNLSLQKPLQLPGGFDMMLLDGMYQQGATMAAMSGYGTNGSNSSVALGSAGRPAMLALPAPPVPNSGPTTLIDADPFAASLGIAPPSYVQISDMEKKQKLLLDEQLMWQKFAKDGMQGHAQHSSYHYSTGGYTHNH